MDKNNLTYHQLADLTFRQFDERLTVEEQETLSEWINLSAGNKDWFDKIASPENLREGLHDYYVTASDKQEQRMHHLFLEAQAKLNAPPVHFLRRQWLKYAAAIIIMLGIGAYLRTISKKPEQTLATANKADIPPGGDKATLTLADGSRIVLENAANGNLADQGGVQVMKLANGQIVYDLKGLSGKDLMWNTMSTPRGGQYQVVLPDGTKVWLNAASSITFPAAFTGNERKVKVDGEAYFEVARNNQKPFLVDIRGESSIEVLGTHFNVNSYKDENGVRTTLTEGSIRVANAGDQAILSPGQQAIVAKTGAITVNFNTDIDETLAWKNGLFSFSNSDLPSAMRQLERWYDIDVKYEGKVPDVTLIGKMYRNINLSDVLDFLQKMGVKCRLEEKTVIIM